MREILFRGFSEEYGWIYGDYIDCSDILSRDYSDNFDADIAVSVIPETVGQFTGLTDKNGMKIFEGDVVKTKYGRICEVKWFASPCFQGFDLRPFEDLHLPPDRFDMYAGENLEIIGNIYNNSDIIAERMKDEND